MQLPLMYTGRYPLNKTITQFLIGNQLKKGGGNQQSLFPFLCFHNQMTHTTIVNYVNLESMFYLKYPRQTLNVSFQTKTAQDSLEHCQAGHNNCIGHLRFNMGTAKSRVTHTINGMMPIGKSTSQKRKDYS